MCEMKVEGVIFDLDGTLVHTIEDLSDAANVQPEKHGYEAGTIEDYTRYIGNGARKFIEQAIGGKVDPGHLPELVQEFKQIYAENLSNKSRIYGGIEKVLDAIQEAGIRMAVLSNKPHHLTLKVCDHYLSSWHFKAIFGQRDQVPRKPDPSAAIEISSIMGVPPEKILFVGDSVGDMRTALAAGMIPVGVEWGYGKPGEEFINGEKYILGNPGELLDLIRN